MNETTKEYSVTKVEDLKISDTDITDNGVSSLRQTPNRGSTYGTDGLSAENLKKRFDQLPAFIARKLNALIQSLYNGTFPLDVPLGGEKSISELLASVTNGELAEELYLSAQEKTLATFVDDLIAAVEKVRTDTYGYYYSYIDIANKKIYLTKDRVVPEIGTANRTDETFETPDYNPGDKLCLVNASKYDWGALGSATISSIQNNVIGYEGDIGFTSIEKIEEKNLGIDDYTLFVIEAPKVGPVKVREGALNFGDGSASLGLYSVAEGRDTLAVGNYSRSSGRETRAHYCASAEGRKSKAIGEHSHAENYDTKAEGNASHTQGVQTVTEKTAYAASAEGRGTVATKEASHVQGRWNERDAAQRYVHVVGWGAGDKLRKNIHTVDTEGNAWFRGRVFVGGDSQDEATRLVTETELENALRSLVGDAPEALDTLYEIVRLIGAGDSDLSKTLLVMIREAKTAADAAREQADAANTALDDKAKKSDLEDVRSTLTSMVTAGLDRKADKDKVSTDLSDLRKRVVNIEHGLTLDPFRVDKDVAYTKSPPEGVLPYARILEVGGRSTVHKNLFDLAKLGEWWYSEGGASTNDNGGVYINTSGGGCGTVYYGVRWDEPDSAPIPLTAFCDVQVGKTYTLSCISDLGQIRLLANTWDGSILVTGGESRTFVMTQQIIDEGICFEYVNADDHGYFEDFSYTVDQIMLVEGTVAGEYIASAVVTSIDVVGENKLPYPYPLLPNEVTVDGLTITPRADGSILLNGTLEKSGTSNYLSVYLHGNPTEGRTLDWSIHIGKAKSTLFLEPGYYYTAPTTMEGANLCLKHNGNPGGINGALNIRETDSYHQVGYVYYLALLRGTTFNNAVLYPYIVKGQVAPETWTPYVCERVEIPEAVRALPGYGKGNDTHYNRVVWNDDGTKTYIQAVDDDGNVMSHAVATDITEYISGSNVIKVAPGTTITAVNENRLPVPFSIKYQLKQYVYE